MGFYLSPGVYVKELDLSEIVPSVATSIGALVGYSKKGAVDKRVLVTNNQQFVNEFGKPEPGNYFHYSALAYLEKGNKLYCVRTINGALYGGAIILKDGVEVNRAISSGFASAEFEGVSGLDILFYIFGKDPGVWDNKISVTVSTIDSNDEFTIEVYYDGDKVENFTVSRIANHLNGYGRNNYLETAINDVSKYIRVADSDLIDSTDIKVQEIELYLDKGEDGSIPTSGQYITSWNLFSNSDEIDVNILIDGGLAEVAIQTNMISICESRKDCIAILDPLYDDDEVTEVVEYRKVTLNANTSYASLFSHWLKAYDKDNDIIAELPPSGYIAGVIAYSDYVSEPWFAPAGFNRGKINVLGLKKVFTQGERDILYEAGINPIQSFIGEGIVVWGQKTLLSRASALDRINVRRLLIVIQKSVSRALRIFNFEPNDDLTRLRIIQMIDDFLRDVEARRGLYEYKIVCDESNNPPEVIDKNELHIDVYLKPVRAAEFIQLQTIVTKTGASFEELITRI